MADIELPPLFASLDCDHVIHLLGAVLAEQQIMLVSDSLLLVAQALDGCHYGLPRFVHQRCARHHKHAQPEEGCRRRVAKEGDRQKGRDDQADAPSHTKATLK